MNNNIRERLKILIVLVALFLSTDCILGQKGNTFSIDIGFGGNQMLVNGFEKEEGFSNDGMLSIGLFYQHQLSNNISFKTGLNYSRTIILVAAGYHPYWSDVVGTQSWDTHLLSLPFHINYKFYKYLFIEGGPMLDLQFNIWDSQPTDTQTGIGAGIGIGGVYNYKNLCFTLSPFINYHAIVQYDSYNKDRLFEYGIKCGIGYKF